MSTNPRPKQLNVRDNSGVVAPVGKFLKSVEGGKTDYDELLDTPLSSKLVRRGQNTYVTPFQDGSNEGRVISNGVDLLLRFTHNNVTTTSGATGSPLLSTSDGAFCRSGTQAVASQVAGWARSGSPVFRPDAGLRAISKFGSTGSASFTNLGWGLAQDLSLTSVVAASPPTPFVGLQFLTARDTNFQFVSSDGSNTTIVDTGVVYSAGPFYFEVEIESDVSEARYCLRDSSFNVLASATITTDLPATFDAMAPIGAIQTTAAIQRSLDTYFFLLDCSV